MASQCENIKGKNISQQTKLARKRNHELIKNPAHVQINSSKSIIFSNWEFLPKGWLVFKGFVLETESWSRAASGVLERSELFSWLGFDWWLPPDPNFSEDFSRVWILESFSLWKVSLWPTDDTGMTWSSSVGWLGSFTIASIRIFWDRKVLSKSG